MIEGKTRTGFKFKIDERATKDWRIVEGIKKVSSRNYDELAEGISSIVDLLLGDDKDRLMSHVQKNNDGFIPVDELEKELSDIIAGANQVKNSQSSPE